MQKSIVLLNHSVVHNVRRPKAAQDQPEGRDWGGVIGGTGPGLRMYSDQSPRVRHPGILRWTSVLKFSAGNLC